MDWRQDLESGPLPRSRLAAATAFLCLASSKSDLPILQSGAQRTVDGRLPALAAGAYCRDDLSIQPDFYPLFGDGSLGRPRPFLNWASMPSGIFDAGRDLAKSSGVHSGFSS